MILNSVALQQCCFSFIFMMSYLVSIVEAQSGLTTPTSCFIDIPGLEQLFYCEIAIQSLIMASVKVTELEIQIFL